MTIKVDNYFGGCPHCGRTDGWANISRSHWCFCKTHKTKWCFGINLLSSWRNQTEDEQRRVLRRDRPGRVHRGEAAAMHRRRQCKSATRR